MREKKITQCISQNDTKSAFFKREVEFLNDLSLQELQIAGGFLSPSPKKRWEGKEEGKTEKKVRGETAGVETLVFGEEHQDIWNKLGKLFQGKVHERHIAALPCAVTPSLPRKVSRAAPALGGS